MEKLYNKSIDYLRLLIPEFMSAGVTTTKLCTCPACKKMTLRRLSPTDIMYHCVNLECQFKGTIFDFVRVLEKEKVTWTDNEIVKYLGPLLKVEVVTTEDVQSIFKKYQEYGFDLVPVQRNGKIPIEKDWTNKTHKDSEEWTAWYNQDLNMGVKTGKISNVTFIDIDSKKVPAGLAKFFTSYQGFLQETNKGFHYAYQYDADLPKTSFDFEGVHVDIENNGGQVVIFPSTVSDIDRKIKDSRPIPKLPEELKQFLLSQIKRPITREEPTDSPDLNVETIGEGNRNNFMIKIGGILKKDFNIEETRKILELINGNFVKPPLPKSELQTILGSLNKYFNIDEQDLARKILMYLKIVGEANARDVQEVVGETKENVEKSLAFLLKEGYITKHRRLYQIIRKAEWKDTFPLTPPEVKFTVPYFHDIAHFNYGDMLLLGSKSKNGKTTIAMNMIKRLVDQGIKPYYICLETGSRFQKTWTHLGGGEGQFLWDFVSDPTKIELEKNAVTIIDWLLIEDKSQTDAILKHFVEQLFKTNGFLIIFMQLKENNSWFAPNMIEFFPAMLARYIYTDNTGTHGVWHIDAIRDPRLHQKKSEIPCIYDWGKKLFRRQDEITGGEKND